MDELGEQGVRASGSTARQEFLMREAVHPSSIPENSPEWASVVREVAPVRRAAQICFGANLENLVVLQVVSAVHMRADLSNVQVRKVIAELHLKRAETTNFLSPFARLQATLSRELQHPWGELHRMERSKDDRLLTFTCNTISKNTCWDLLNSGACPRKPPRICKWEHPFPTVFSLTLVNTQPPGRTPLNTQPPSRTPLQIQAQLFQPRSGAS